VKLRSDKIIVLFMCFFLNICFALSIRNLFVKMGLPTHNWTSVLHLLALCFPAFTQRNRDGLRRFWGLKPLIMSTVTRKFPFACLDCLCKVSLRFVLCLKFEYCLF
jgi:hypothetical protein